MTHFSAWLGGGAGAGVVLMASVLGATVGAAHPAATPAPTLQATLPAERVSPSGPRFAPACQAMLRGTGGCESARASGRLLRT